MEESNWQPLCCESACLTTTPRHMIAEINCALALHCFLHSELSRSQKQGCVYFQGIGFGEVVSVVFLAGSLLTVTRGWVFKQILTDFFQPERFVNLGIDPPKGILLFGPPGTGKTLCARAVANRTDACFIRVIGSELVQKYVGEVRNLMFLPSPSINVSCMHPGIVNHSQNFTGFFDKSASSLASCIIAFAVLHTRFRP